MQNNILEYRLPSKIVSDAGTHFVLEKFENFCKKLSNVMQYHHDIIFRAIDRLKHASNVSKEP